MRNRGLALATVVCLCFASGCVYRIFVGGVTAPESPPPSLGAGTKLAVQAFPSLEDDPPDENIARKIESVLETKGFEVTEPAGATYVVLYGYEKSGVLGARVLAPITGPQTGMLTVRREGPFYHRLSLSLVDAAAYRAEGSATALWAGAAVLPNTPQPSKKLIDLLIVAAFERFGEDTETTVKRSIRLGDRQAKKLRRL